MEHSYLKTILLRLYIKYDFSHVSFLKEKEIPVSLIMVVNNSFYDHLRKKYDLLILKFPTVIGKLMVFHFLIRHYRAIAFKKCIEPMWLIQCGSMVER